MKSEIGAINGRSEQEKWNRSGTVADPSLASRHPKTHEAFWKAKLQKRTFLQGAVKTEIPEWQVRLQHAGRREWINLRTTNRDAAAKRARDLYIAVLSGGWDAIVAQWKPKAQKAQKSEQVCTVGEFLTAVKASSTIKPKTLEGYAKAFRMIVAQIAAVPMSRDRFDYRTGGHRRWLDAVEAVKLESITPTTVQKWKSHFLKSAGIDPISQKTARVSVNAFIRNAKALFSPRLLAHVTDLRLPDPLPFANIAFEKPGSLRYRSTIQPEALLVAASTELAAKHPEQYKIFVLALLAGLRRNEIDKLLWRSLDYKRGTIRIEATEYFQPKSEDSAGDVEVDPEVLEILRGFMKGTMGEFVVNSPNAPRLAATYNHYRAESHFEALNLWLRKKGVTGRAPLHVLRKEFGSLMTEKFGIYAASRALRHGRLEVTSAYYADTKSRKTLGMGSLLLNKNAAET